MTTPLWNTKLFKQPYMDFCAYDTEDKQSIDDLSQFVAILIKVSDQIGIDHVVWEEIKVFKALEIRLKSKLPCDKFLHIFQRIGHCLRNFVLLDLSKLYLDLADLFLKEMRNSNSHSKQLQIPSCQQLEYLLIRTQGAAKLLCQMLSYITDSFVYLIQKLRIGHLLQSLLMACSVIARIHVSYKALLQQLCNAYQELKPQCDKLKRGTWKWPCELLLPENLWHWLEPEKSELQRVELPKEELSFLNKRFKTDQKQKDTDSNVPLITLSDDESEIIDMECEIVEKQSTANANEHNVVDSDQFEEDFLQQNIDLGEVISRCSQPAALEETEMENHESQSTDKIESISETMPLLEMITQTKNRAALSFLCQQICSEENLFSYLLPHSLTDIQKNKINRQLSKLAQNVKKIKSQDTHPVIKKKHIRKKLESAKTAIATHLRLITKDCDSVNEKDSGLQSETQIQPVKTLLKLQRLFKNLNCILTSSKEKKLQKQLNCMFKNGYRDAKLLQQRGFNKLSRRFIKRTSKKMILLCSNFVISSQ